MLIDVRVAGRARRASLRSKETRMSLQALVDGEIEHLGKWLRQTAQGIPRTTVEGTALVDLDGAPQWLVRPDPASAIKLVSDLAEYVIPKLSRSEATVVAQVENNVHFDVDKMSSSDLKRFLLRQSGVDAEELELFGQELDQARLPVTVDQAPTCDRRSHVESVGGLPDWLRDAGK